MGRGKGKDGNKENPWEGRPVRYWVWWTAPDGRKGSGHFLDRATANLYRTCMRTGHDCKTTGPQERVVAIDRRKR